MSFDFNSITQDQEKITTAKFKEYGVGVAMGKFVTSENTSKWAELIDTSIYSATAIKNKMLEIARTINTACNDEFLGNMETAFTVRDNKNKLISFTYIEMYTFLRAALRFRKESEDYKAKYKEASKLRTFLNENKSTEDKIKEASEALAKLDLELGD